MTTGILIVIFLASILGFAGLVYYILHNVPHPVSPRKAEEQIRADMTEQVNNIFNDEFREELRNHGRLYFDKIVSENAMFLQQDLRLTSSQINDYMKKEINTKLQAAFASYEQSMQDAQNASLEAIQKTMRATEEQHAIMTKQAQELAMAEKERAVKHFEDNMGDIVNHYLAEAFGNQLSLGDQVGYIIGEMEANKEAMKQDMYS
ncbi:MAG TPA: hypothetical protein VD735_00150 [Candidatus Saccharimonadales bacterium]|nr:hypothetical protein [Candidatus Saccharimonadales bacterium]